MNAKEMFEAIGWEQYVAERNSKDIVAAYRKGTLRIYFYRAYGFRTNEKPFDDFWNAIYQQMKELGWIK